MHFEHLHFVAAEFLFKPISPMPSTLGRSRNFGNDGDDFLRELHVLGFLGVDAKPAEMRQAELRGALRLVLGELAEIIVESRAPNCGRSPPRTPVRKPPAQPAVAMRVIVRDAADHVGVGFDVAHSA